MANPVGAFPPFLKITDIMDATQYCRKSVYNILKEAEKTPGIVIRRGEKGVRVHRDNFFRWFLMRNNMTVPDELKGA
ncbi:hypothetical protein H7B90_23750 [Cohnella xylanilytica]|uniref:Helix-turn-helix protein n=1 Tax=Cohnella xylanilytica TaxID=557555 RepID=A0A841U1K4_9BACL|nr:hypothetical protein [Cohnella xylanilytica]MBB6694416.1 hypothetical protein [Cohnella xylanilytica]